LQLGYFAQPANAQGFRETLREAGFEADVVVTGRPDRLRYRVITGGADAAAELLELRDEITARVGTEGFALRNPYKAPSKVPAAEPSAEEADNPFALHAPALLQARATPDGLSGGPDKLRYRSLTGLADSVAEPFETEGGPGLNISSDGYALPGSYATGPSVAAAESSEALFHAVRAPPGFLQARAMPEVLSGGPDKLCCRVLTGPTDSVAESFEPEGGVSSSTPTPTKGYDFPNPYTAPFETPAAAAPAQADNPFELPAPALLLARATPDGLSGGPDKLRYRILTGPADSVAEPFEFEGEVSVNTPIEGYALPNPYTAPFNAPAAEAPAQADNPFALSAPFLLLAQATPEGSSGGPPMRVSEYAPGFDRTPQEDIESIPGFTLGGLQIVPTIGLSLGYDDNITRSSFGEISSWFYMISPAVRVELPSDRSVLALVAGANVVRYEDSPIDDRETWWLSGQWDWDISDRQNLNVFGEYREGVDRRGEGRRQGDAGLIPVEPDEWERWGFGGEWDYGAIGARGRLALRAGYYDLEYTNNREGILPGDAGTVPLDRDWQFYGGTFYWRVAPKTSLLAEYSFTDMDYALEDQSDSEVETWLLGLTWDATARTRGEIAYGKQKRRFDDPTLEGYDGAAWRASINWRPRTYSQFTLAATRNTQEPNGYGDYVLRQDVTLSWLHDWATRFGTTVDVGYGEDSYRPDGREDELWYWGVGARYTFNSHLRFGASVTGYDRTSQDPEFDYQRTVYMLTLEASF
jgi:hypothetical protein